MAKTSAASNREILEAALLGLEAQRAKIEDRIAEVRTLLGNKSARRAKAALPSVDVAPKSLTGKRVLSDEARKRIVAAQKKRWAAYRKNQK